jgi:NADPH:quinone reductase-like Zn-dependent oxidoreductase/SAM-dependent methyltransferase
VTAHAEPGWDNELDLVRDHTWLADHRVQGAVVLPAAAHVELALAAARQLFGPDALVLEELKLERPLLLSHEALQPVQLLVDRLQRFFSVNSRPAGSPPDASPWVRYSTGRLGRKTAAAAPPLPVEQVRERCPNTLDRPTCYQEFIRVGLEYGPAFQGIEQLWRGDRETLGKIVVSEFVAASLADYLFHPAVLDACFQTLLGALPAGEGTLYLPARVDRICVRRPLQELAAETACPRVFWTHARQRELSEGRLTGDLNLCDAGGAVLVEVVGLHCRALGGGRPDGLRRLRECLQQEQWLLQQLPGEPPMPTPAWRLPDPQTLAAAVRPATAALVQQFDLLRQHREAVRRDNALATVYFVATCRRLGWDFAAGRRHTTHELLERLRVIPAYHRLFHRFLERLAGQGILRQIGEAWEVVRTPATEDPTLLWRSWVADQPAYHAVLAPLATAGSRLAEVLTGEADALQVLFPNGSATALEALYLSAPATRIYKLMVQEALAALVRRLPEDRPLRVLEIGGGTGGATADVLPVLPATRTRYVFTDVSRPFLGRAEERFAGYPFVTYQALDIEQDPVAQGFAPHSFDVILAADVLHATADLGQALASVKRLLASNGLLVLVELNQDLLLPVFGILKGWWRFTDRELRPHSPLLPGPRWCEWLRSIGFAEAEPLTDVPWEDQPVDSVLLAQGPRIDSSVLPLTEEVPRPMKSWLILADRGDIGKTLAAALKERGDCTVLAWTGPAYRHLETDRFEVRPTECVDLEQLLHDSLGGHAVWTDIIHLWSLDAPALEEAQPFPMPAAVGCLQSTVELVRACGRRTDGQQPRLWLVTRGVQPAGMEAGPALVLAQSPLWGFGRVLANEHPRFHTTLLDLSPACPAEEIEALADELCRNDDEDEIALRGRDRYVHRLTLTPVGEPVRATAADGTAAVPFRLEPGASGLLDDLALCAMTRTVPGPGQVEIEVQAAALNFQDVAKVMHLLGDASLEGTFSGRQLGLECAGRVVAVGAAVADFKAGDDVFGLALGSFASHAVTDARFLMHKPADMTFEETATLPIVFMTARYALHDLARLQPGERVLIHAASGGVGLAAIQLARRAGAEIFATAGSPEKRAFLRDLGVKHVMDSRSLDFVEQIMAETAGKGVDVVLNSLGGAALVHSVAALGEGGRFLELGKRDLELNTKLSQRPFLKQLSFFAIDLDRLLAARPAVALGVFKEVMQDVAAGRLRPLPHLVFPISRIQESFQTMLKARHIGKVVVAVKEPHLAVQPPPLPAPGFRSRSAASCTTPPASRSSVPIVMANPGCRT